VVGWESSLGLPWRSGIPDHLGVGRITNDQRSDGQGVWKKILLIGVRLGLTGLSVLLTAPYLTQFVFRADIEADLRRDQSLAIDQARQAIAARTEAKLDNLHKMIQADREGLILEVSGRGRSKRYGDGLTSNAIRERI